MRRRQFFSALPAAAAALLLTKPVQAHDEAQVLYFDADDGSDIPVQVWPEQGYLFQNVRGDWFARVPCQPEPADKGYPL